MRKFIGGAGLASLAVIVAAATTAAVMAAVRPAEAQEPTVVVRSFGSSASIGVSIRDVTGEDAVKAKMAQPAGVYVESVREGSPASKAGLQAGDIVVDFDGERVRSASHFTRLVQESVPSRQVAAVVLRGTSRQTVNVVPDASGGLNLLSGDARVRLQNLGKQVERDLTFNFDADRAGRLLSINGGTLGVTLSPLSDQLAGYFGVKEGVLVSSVASNSAAASAGVRAGDVITAINGQSVSSSADVTRALRGDTDGAVDITVMRDKKSMSLKATIQGRTPRTPAGRSGRGGLPV